MTMQEVVHHAEREMRAHPAVFVLDTSANSLSTIIKVDVHALCSHAICDRACSTLLCHDPWTAKMHHFRSEGLVHSALAFTATTRVPPENSSLAWQGSDACVCVCV